MFLLGLLQHWGFPVSSLFSEVPLTSAASMDHHHHQMEAHGILQASCLFPRKASFLQRPDTERFLINLLLSRLSNSSVLHSSLDAQKLAYLIRFKEFWNFVSVGTINQEHCILLSSFSLHQSLCHPEILSEIILYLLPYHCQKWWIAWGFWLIPAELH